MARTFYLPACPDVDPGTVIQFQYDPGTGPIMASFDLERSYRNFVLYLYDKLRPDYFAIMAALDRFNWSKPVAIAELGGRSCQTLQFIDDGINRFIIQPPGDLTSQAFWLDHFLESARQRKFEFYVQVFREDYDPIGLWAERQGVLPEDLYNVNNIFPCMGLYDNMGQTKAGITDLWQDALP
jgi:hypothetical protein